MFNLFFLLKWWYQMWYLVIQDLSSKFLVYNNYVNISECFILCCVSSTMKTKPEKKQSLEIYHNEKQGCFWSNEYWYDNVNFLQKKNGRSLLLEQDTLRWDDDICFVLD